MIASEMSPFAKTGGLGDVVGSLPLELARLGHDVSVFLPYYSTAKLGPIPPLKEIEYEVPLGERREQAEIFSGRRAPRLMVYFVRNHRYFDREELYGNKEGDYPDNGERFAFFSRAVLEAIKHLGMPVDIFHCHDWQAALVPACLRILYREKELLGKGASILTVHNLAYQGVFSPETLALTGLGPEFFTPEKLEFWGKVSFLKGGLLYADQVNTVSERYSQEIQTEEFGCGLEGVLRNRASDLSGVLNGIDTKTWDPETDPALVSNYSARDPSFKEENKQTLQDDNGLSLAPGIPLIGMVTRLASQKGLDILGEALGPLVTRNKLQFVILGKGDIVYHQLLEKLAKRYPRKVAVHLGFDEKVAHRIYAGSDMFLIPSRYEPCGLGQMISLRYGTIPLVRETGGLADTVEEYDPGSGQGNGFRFREYSATCLTQMIKKATSVYRKKRFWKKLVRNAMACDFSWKKSAEKYVELYQKALEKKKNDEQ